MRVRWVRGVYNNNKNSKTVPIKCQCIKMKNTMRQTDRFICLIRCLPFAKRGKRARKKENQHDDSYSKHKSFLIAWFPDTIINTQCGYANRFSFSTFSHRIALWRHFSIESLSSKFKCHELHLCNKIYISLILPFLLLLRRRRK